MKSVSSYSAADFAKRDVDDQQSLTDALAWASYKYYVENDPPMSDYEFDMEFKRLQALERESGRVLPGSPTQRVGSDIQGAFRKAKHVIPMQSIENVYSDGELRDWIRETCEKLRDAFPGEEISFTYEPKYDGVSISLVYRDGVLADAVTRGNQVEGESVVENVRTIRNVPLELDRAACPDLPAYFEVRGEVLMPQGAFDRLNAEKAAAGEKPFANKRNAASGSLKQLDPKVTARRGLMVNAFAAYSTDEDFQRRAMPSQVETLRLLRRLGFSYYNVDRAFSDVAELTAAIDAFNEVRTGHKLPYDCDGVVVKVNERRHQEYLGLNTTFPNWCKARKFPQEAQSTLVRDVIFQVGMTGHVTPVADLDPTVIGGAVVSRATLNNEAYIRSLGLRIGSYVFVQRAGEVIPQVSAVDAARTEAESGETRPVVFPERCPACGTPLARKGEFYVCPNHHCREQVVERLEYWCGKDCANIRGIGPRVLADLVDKLAIHSVDDLYRVFVREDVETVLAESQRDKVLRLLGEGYAEKSVAQLFDGVRASIATLTLDRIIGGLAIDGVGRITGRDLAAHFGSLEKLRAATLDDLLAVENIGEITAANIVAFFGSAPRAEAPADDLFAAAGVAVTDDDCHVDDYACLFDPAYGFNTVYRAAERLGSALDGKTVIFTGVSYRFKRDEIKDFLVRHGAKYVGSVSGKVDFVVTGDNPGQNKVDKAVALGVPVIAERDFYARFGL